MFKQMLPFPTNPTELRPPPGDSISKDMESNDPFGSSHSESTFAQHGVVSFLQLKTVSSVVRIGG
jgi:hypothetical protein